MNFERAFPFAAWYLEATAEDVVSTVLLSAAMAWVAWPGVHEWWVKMRSGEP